ncbi:OmpA family protein [Roseomonas sp. NAR14]|uniref:OmpA family protein n=1 Tax=Roseomonas acroporae TaxID=2937791 RepID=A0A9X2BXK0_9PROT|nr:flagellar motor protein MotB [Roseomonas acroporae]MCK8785040.1 OmpA family protein [Roseomonas acroporae]
MSRPGKRGGATIILKRIEEGEHGHHGGAWKVAYADFVTAMMAFFLLMWLLNATTEEQRHGLADYFSPNNLLARSISGSGQPFGGRTPNEDGNATSNLGAMRIEPGPRPVNMDIEEDDSDTPAGLVQRREGRPGQDEDTTRVRAQAGPGQQGGQAGGRAGDRPGGATDGSADGGAAAGSAAQAAMPGAAPPVTVPPVTVPPGTPAALAAERLPEQVLRDELARRERGEFERAAAQIRAAMREDPALAELARQLLVEQAPEGLRVQLLDSDRQPMFASGGTALNERARALVQRVAAVLAPLPNAIAISGHTDATPFRGTERSNWELSAERANATRRLLVEGGVREGRLRSVTGQAEREPLLRDQPNAAANRRVSILLLRQAPDRVAGAPSP